MYACPKLSTSASSKKESAIVVLQECYKDQLTKQLAQAGISHQSWQQEASDRDSWRSSVRKASCEFEAERHKGAKEKRRRQKERAFHPFLYQTFVCPKCSRGCESRACKN